MDGQRKRLLAFECMQAHRALLGRSSRCASTWSSGRVVSLGLSEEEMADLGIAAERVSISAVCRLHDTGRAKSPSHFMELDPCIIRSG